MFKSPAEAAAGQPMAAASSKAHRHRPLKCLKTIEKTNRTAYYHFLRKNPAVLLHKGSGEDHIDFAAAIVHCWPLSPDWQPDRRGKHRTR
jgi:hypothetical protein